MPKITFAERGDEIWDISDDLTHFLLNPNFVGDLDTCLRETTRDFRVYPKQPFSLVLHSDQKQTLRESSRYLPSPYSDLDGVYQCSSNIANVTWDDRLPVNVGLVSTGGYRLTRGNNPVKLWTGGVKLVLPDRKLHIRCPLWAGSLINEEKVAHDTTLIDTFRIEIVNPNHFSVFEIT